MSAHIFPVAAVWKGDIEANDGGVTIVTVEVPENFFPKSQAEWDQVKAALLFQQKWRCDYCNVDLQWSTATLDHMKPRVRGGDDHIQNLTICCRSCNSSKGGRYYAEWRDPERWLQLLADGFIP